MKKSHSYSQLFAVVCYLILLFTVSCGPFEANKPLTPSVLLSQTPTMIPLTPTPILTLTPTHILWSTPYYSAPADEMTALNCRITINYFFSFRKGFSIQSYRNLFAPLSQYLADGITPPDEAPILLELMPASEQWRRDFPGTPMPGTISSEDPNEYFYYVKFTYHYEPNTTPIATFPHSMIMIMVASGDGSCKIKAYGQG